MLRLNRIHHCVLVRKDPRVEGMIKKVKDYVTWGEIADEMLKKLIEKRGRLVGNKKIDPKDVEKILKKIKKMKNLAKDVPEIEPVFRLNPPRKGHGSIKIHYPKGALGYRGEKINELIERML